MVDNEIGQRIRQRRLELGMTQDELARKVGYQTRGAINKIETGYNELKQAMIKPMAQALQMSEAALLGWITPEEEQRIERELDPIGLILNSNADAEFKRIMLIAYMIDRDNRVRALDMFRILFPAEYQLTEGVITK